MFCRLSLGFPLKVVEEGGAIKVKSLEPPCFFFCVFFCFFMIGPFFTSSGYSWWFEWLPEVSES